MLGWVKTGVYSGFMTIRMTKEKWVQHGLKSLEKRGFSALKAEPMAKELKVSRGSFYWHFTDIGEFQKDVLELWRQRTTLQVIVDIEGSGDKSGRLNVLMQRAFNAGRDLERAVRAWAIRNPDVAEVVTRVDIERINYICELLMSEGVLEPDVRSKATFVYWAYLGQTMTAIGNVNQLADSDVEKIVSLLLL